MLGVVNTTVILTMPYISIGIFEVMAKIHYVTEWSKIKPEWSA